MSINQRVSARQYVKEMIRHEMAKVKSHSEDGVAEVNERTNELVELVAREIALDATLLARRMVRMIEKTAGDIILQAMEKSKEKG